MMSLPVLYVPVLWVTASTSPPLGPGLATWPPAGTTVSNGLIRQSPYWPGPPEGADRDFFTQEPHQGPAGWASGRAPGHPCTALLTEARELVVNVHVAWGQAETLKGPLAQGSPAGNQQS